MARKIIIFAVFITGQLIFAGCSEQKTDEAVIIERISLLQKAIETHNSSQFMAIIDSQYYDQINTDRQALQAMLMVFFLRYKDISVFVNATTINIQGIRADAQSQLLLTGGKSIIPENARHYRVHSCWKKVSQQWLLSCLNWQ